MSKKQTGILSFFKPKGKHEIATVEKLPVKFRSALKVETCRNNNVTIASDNVISLLSSDEDDCESVVESFLPVNHSIDLKLHNVEVIEVMPTVDHLSSYDVCDAEDMSDDGFIDPSEFLEVVLEESAEVCIVDSEEMELPNDINDCKLNNFRSMIEWVLNDETNQHLFNDDDWIVIENFTTMTVPSQRLYIRLYVRKHRWIRGTKINYPELGEDLQPFINELVQKQLLLPCEVIENLEEVLQLLDPTELRSCAKSINGVKLSQVISKKSQIDAILKHAKSSQSIRNYFSTTTLSVEEVVLKYVKKILGSTAFCVNENSGRLFSRMSYLFYPPRVNEDENGVFLSQQLFNQLKVEQGELCYPKYKINKKVVIYKARQDLVSFDDACRLENQILVGVEKKEFDFLITKLLPRAESGFHQNFSDHSSVHDSHLPIYLRNQTAGHVFVRSLSHLVSVLEQRKDYEKAVEVLKLLIEQNVYCLYYKGKWIERLSIDLEKHLKKPTDALQEIVNGLKDSNVKAGFRYSIYQRGKSICQRLAKSVSKNPIAFDRCSEFDFEKCQEVTVTAETLDRDVNGRKNIFTTTNDEGDITCISVEEAALRHYKKNGFLKGIHSEGMVYHALLNLLLWDIIYSDVIDAFRTSSQSLPLDFSTEYFYTQRAKEIDERLCEIKNFSQTELEMNLEHVWTENYGTTCLISWEAVNIQDLKDIAHCIGNKALAGICRRMCHHFRFTHSGFPDLLVWNVESKMIKAVEVKGPNDSLSSKQILWMQYFKTIGFPTEVCYVKSANKCRK